MAVKSRIARKKRHRRVRQKISGTPERPRLCVFRSVEHIYAQLIDDVSGETLTSASTIDKGLRVEMQDKSKTEQAKLVGESIAKRAMDAGFKQVVFDRGGNLYHGRVKALADGAREAGLSF